MHMLCKVDVKNHLGAGVYEISTCILFENDTSSQKLHHGDVLLIRFLIFSNFVLFLFVFIIINFFTLYVDIILDIFSFQVTLAFICYFFNGFTWQIDRFGHFKIWHGAGSVLVAISFSSVFGGCLPCTIFANHSSTLETVSYSVFAAIFNVGWAATQVSHM